MDAIHGVNSGHPGLPLGAADLATVLYTRFFKFDPQHPDWPDRDRFVMSAGHGSMLLYSLSYLLGYLDMTIDQIKRFRRLGSRTPGHPELDVAVGIEATTGPLGQGLGMAVGMALSERMLRARFGAGLVDHYTYALVGDGCLMEGVSYEAAAFAGHLGLDRLIVLFDDNGISIDGPTSLATSEDQEMRFRACGWDYFRCDGHDPDAIAAAIEKARAAPRPAVVACKTRIGYALPGKEGTAAAHGMALTAAEVAGARETLGWPHDPFVVPEAIVAAWRRAGRRRAAEQAAWAARLAAADADVRETFRHWLAADLPKGWEAALAACKKALCEAQATEPTRLSSRKVVETLTPVIPNLIGGSADLTASNLSKPQGVESVSATNFAGRYIHFGVREHAMAAITNGLVLHGGFIPFCATFLCFADYCRPAIRLSALMGQRVIYLLTHDTITMGPDGPTHQSVEHFAMLRATPNFLLFRPADGVEVAECWELALKEKGRPVGLVMTREAVPPVRKVHAAENLCARGAYVFAEADGEARVTLLATGSEVWVALGARDILQAEGIGTRVVSMPCLDLFDEQPADWRTAILGEGTLRVSIEAASAYGWERYVGPDGLIIGMTTFGKSGLPDEVMEHFGITPEQVAAAVRAKL
jgi:transketolase